MFNRKNNNNTKALLSIHTPQLNRQSSGSCWKILKSKLHTFRVTFHYCSCMCVRIIRLWPQSEAVKKMFFFFFFPLLFLDFDGKPRPGCAGKVKTKFLSKTDR